MTLIQYKALNGKYDLSIQGHAEYAEQGKDIVCAAISALTYTALNAIDNMEGVIKDIHVSDGDVKINVTPITKEHDYDLRIVFDVIMGGLRMLENRYRGNIAITTIS